MKIQMILCCAAGAALTSACATISEGSSDSIYVVTSPAGASCAATRDGGPVGHVNPTPGSMTVDKSKKAITLDCGKEGYLDARGVIASEMEAMTFGNLIFGGLIGVAVDASSGALNDYPESITIEMTPAAFPNEEERDEFFQRREDRIAKARDAAVAAVNRNCDEARANCKDKIKQAEDAYAKAIAELEAERSAVRIAG